MSTYCGLDMVCIVESGRCLHVAGWTWYVWLRVVGVYILWVGHGMYS